MAINFLFKTFDVMKILKWCVTSATMLLHNCNNDNKVQGFSFGIISVLYIAETHKQPSWMCVEVPMQWLQEEG